MATPPGGSPYGGPQQPGYGAPYSHGYGTQPYGGGQQQGGRYGFPSSPSPQVPQQAPEHGPQHQPMYQPAPEPARPAQAPPTMDQPLVRPYAMTGGRTRPRYQLAIEALVSSTADVSQTTGMLPEHQRIIQLCREVKSVAEISALLTIPLGVARILVADLAESGMVAIHQPAGAEEAGAQPDVTLLERVLSGLRKL